MNDNDDDDDEDDDDHEVRGNESDLMATPNPPHPPQMKNKNRLTWMMSVQMASRKPVSWETTSTVACVSFWRRLMNQSTVAWSRWLVGSSSSMMSGWIRMHRASASFMRHPPLSAEVGPLSLTSSNPSSRMSASICVRFARPALGVAIDS